MSEEIPIMILLYNFYDIKTKPNSVQHAGN